MLQGILLDIDGTLLLSNQAHAQAWADALKEFGYDIPRSTIEPLIGMGGDKVLDRLVPGSSEDEGIGKEITDRRKQIFLERYLPHLKPSPGARALVQRLKNDGLTITVATSASGEELEGLLKAAQVDDLIEETATSDDAESSKPDPDIVAAALEKSHLPADSVLMLGDTPYDIESAGKAGIGVIAVRCGGHDTDLQGALAVYDDPADILAHYDESPLGREIAAAR